jgi:uncharacterized phage-associated protein/DNA-binding transcriptional regulator YiaG
MKLVKEPGVKLNFRKEEFELTYHYYLCEDSKEHFTTDELDRINQTQVHNRYREKYGIPFPEEIRAIRDKYEMSASKMSEILGFGANSYRLYESGEIPSVANGRLIADIEKPEVFLKQVLASSELLTPKERGKLERRATDMIEKQKNNFWEILSAAEKKFYYEFPNHLSGFKKLDTDKIVQLITYFGREIQPLKTKLNKLLFYSDFGYFRRTGYSMTGITYRAIPWGPVPAEYENLYNQLANEGKIQISNIEFPNGYDGEAFEGLVEFEKANFNEIELDVLSKVALKFKDLTSKQIVDLSHEEIGWIENKDNRELISYPKYAFELKNFD